MEWLGYPAVATASASVAYSLGYDDRQQITLDAMVDVVGRVASAVQVPVTADLEWGYAEQPDDVAENMRRVLRPAPWASTWRTASARGRSCSR